jgi:hypothetical protein
MSFTSFDPNYSGSRLTLSNSNLTVATNAPNDGSPHHQMVRATEGKTSGQWYFECHIDVMPSATISIYAAVVVGIVGYKWQGGSQNPTDIGYVGNQDFSVPASTRSGLGASSGGQWGGNNIGGGINAGSGGTATTPTTSWVVNDRIDIAVDVDARLIWARRNGGNWNSSGTANPATGVGGQLFEGSYSGDTDTLGTRMWPAVSLAGYQDQITCNFGATAFVGTPPSGFAGWSSTYDYVDNLSYPTTGVQSLASRAMWVGDFTPSAPMFVGGMLANVFSTGATQAAGVIYDATGSGGAPGSLIAAGNVLASGVAGPGWTMTFASSPTLAAGTKYYIGYVLDGLVTGAISNVTTTGYTAGSGTPSPGAIPAIFPTPTAVSSGRGPAIELLVGTPPPPVVRLAMDDFVCTTTVATPTQNLVFIDWSDDRGHSYGNPVGQSMGATGEYRTSLQWQRLGYARDRVFRIFWSVPTRTALQGAWIDVTPAQS